MSRKLMLWSGALALLMALPAVQPAKAGTWSVKAGGGASIPTGDFGSEDQVNASTGFNIGGGVDYRLNDMWAFGVDGSWNQNKNAHEGDVVTIVSESFIGDATLDKDKFDTWEIGAHGKYFIPAGPSVSPYLLGGVGIYNTTEKFDFTPTDGSPSGSGETTTDTRFGFKGGIGGVFKVNEMFGVAVEGNYNFISQDKDKVGVDNLQYIGLTGAIVFNIMQ